MSESPKNISIMDEKEAARTMQVEDVSEEQTFDPAELEPKMNWQTVLAFLVSTSHHLQPEKDKH